MESTLPSPKGFNKEEYERTLEGFIGTENYYEIGFGMKCTDGVKYIIEALEFPGILDLMALMSITEEFKTTYFRVIKLTNSDKAGKINFVMQDGEYNVLVQHYISSIKTIPVDSIEIWSEHDVFYLPSER
jgi:hypothetical protein